MAVEWINKGRTNCNGEVFLDDETIPGRIVVTCTKCSLEYNTKKL